MSAPRYIITLRVGESSITRKCKTRLGDYEGLVEELKEWDISALAAQLSDKYGGVAELEKIWLEQSRRFLKEE